MTQQLAGKVALITGASSGIGRASALAFARAGAKVAVADVVVEEGEKTAHMIDEIGGEAIFIKTDVSISTEVRALVRETVAVFGALDCTLNNAGIEGNRASTAAYKEEDWDRVMDINLKGVWLCMKYAIPYMRERGGGAIVNMASVNGLCSGMPGFPAYTASKHGVVGLTKAAAAEYAKVGIRINALCPGYIQTPMIETHAATNNGFSSWLKAFVPAGRLGTAEEIAEAAVWLCSDASAFVVGHTMAIDGGYLAQ